MVCRDPAWTEPATTFWAKSSTAIVDEAIRFIKANQDRPFYANVWTLLPHAPLNPTPEQLKVYESLAPRADDPAFGRWMQQYLGEAKDLKSQMQVFCASLTDLDTQIGRLLQTLDELDLADNTIVFFSSDNGAEDYRIGNAANAGVGNTGPLRARKRSMYEGGIRTFGLVRWPGHVAAGRVDETSVIGGVDWLPTICKLAGVAVPDSVQPDGEDVSDIWLGQSRPRRKPLHWEWLFRVWGDEYQPPMLAIRDGDVETARQPRRQPGRAVRHPEGLRRGAQRGRRASGRGAGTHGQGAGLAEIPAAERGPRPGGRHRATGRHTAQARESQGGIAEKAGPGSGRHVQGQGCQPGRQAHAGGIPEQVPRPGRRPAAVPDLRHEPGRRAERRRVRHDGQTLNGRMHARAYRLGIGIPIACISIFMSSHVWRFISGVRSKYEGW